MSSFPFNPKLGPIVVRAEATGPVRTANLNLILDTGATTSLFDLDILIYTGFDPNQPVRRARVITGSTAANLPVFALTRFSALGQHRFGFPIVAHRCTRTSAPTDCLGWISCATRSWR